MLKQNKWCNKSNCKNWRLELEKILTWEDVFMPPEGPETLQDFLTPLHKM